MANLSVMRNAALATVAFIVAGCAQGTTPSPTPTARGASIPNPASVHCEEQGGKVEIRTATDGSQYGVCVFPDGGECEEWAFYRGDCKPGNPAASQLRPDDRG